MDSLRGGGTDEVFQAAQEAAQQAQRDSQGRLILAIFQPSPTPVTIGTRNWLNSLEFGARLLREQAQRENSFHNGKMQIRNKFIISRV